MIDDQVFDDIVTGFYSAASGNLPWVDALLPMQREMAAFLVHLHAIDVSRGGVAFSYEAGGVAPEGTLDYIRTYHRIDPRANLLLKLNPGEWANCWEIFDDAFVASDPFYQEFLIPYGGRYASGTKLLQEGPVSVILGIHRGYGSAKLTQSEIEVCQRLARHLAAALKQHHVYLQRQQANGLGAELLSKINTPVALIDEERRLLSVNPAARQFFEGSTTLVESDGRLYCRRKESDNALFIALRDLQLTSSGAAPPITTDKIFLQVRSAANDEPVGLCLYALRPEATLHAFGERSLAMLMIYDPHQKLRLDPFIVAACFDLSPGEARVAVALAEGMSAEEIAKKHRVSMSTVRTQLKAVFAKTGVSRQAELVSILARLPTAALGTLPG